MFSQLFGSHTGIFVLGALSVGVAKALVGGVGGVLRPVVKGTIKSGIVLGQGAQTVLQKAKEDLEDLSAEAISELSDEESPAAAAARSKVN